MMVYWYEKLGKLKSPAFPPILIVPFILVRSEKKCLFHITPVSKLHKFLGWGALSFDPINGTLTCSVRSQHHLIQHPDSGALNFSPHNKFNP